MARLVGPEDGSRLAYQITSDNRLATAGGLTAVVYADQAATQLADILTTGGAPIAGSRVTVDVHSLIPLFQFPDGVTTVYVSVNGGPITPVYTRVQPAAGSDQYLEYVQSSPSSNWTISHNFGRHPNVSVLDSTDTFVLIGYTHLDLNRVNITFPAPFAGKAVLSA